MDDTVPVLMTLRFTEEQLDRLRAISPRLAIRQQSVHEDREDISSFVNGDEEIIYGMTPPRDLSRAPHLKWVQLHSAGLNRLPEHPIWSTSILVTTSSGIHAVPIGEFALAMMLALARKLPKLFRFQERAEWPRHKWEQLVGTELRDKTIGIVGYGSIGREVARLAKQGFNMHVGAMRYDNNPERARYYPPGVGDPAGTIPERWYDRRDLRVLLGNSDFVLLSLPLTTESKHLMGEPELHAMKHEAFLINIARGELVDERALARALKENWIAGAGLDAYATEPLPRDSQLWHCDNAILSPHVSAATPHYDDRAVDMFGENLKRYLAGMPLLNLVDRQRGY